MSFSSDLKLELLGLACDKPCCKLAESYGAKGIRVTKKEEIAAAFEAARKTEKVPALIEFIIDPEEMVYPMIRPGGTLEDMIMDC